MKEYPFRFKKRKIKAGYTYNVLFDFDPTKQRATGVLVEENPDYPEMPFGLENAIAECYRMMNIYKPTVVPTFGTYVKDFFLPNKCSWSKRILKRHNKTPSYFSEMRARVDRYILPKWKYVPMDLIKTKEIEDWLLELKGIQSNKKLSGSSLNKIITPLRYIFDQAVYDEIISFNPAKEIKMFPDRTAVAVAFTEEEINKLFPSDFNKCKKLWGTLEWYTYFYMMYTCGLRPGEVSALRWSDWKKQSHGAVITRSYDSVNKTIKGLKTDKSGATCKLAIFTPRLEDLLKRLELKKKSDQMFLYPNQIRFNDGRFRTIYNTADLGKYIESPLSQSRFKRVCKKVGIITNLRQYNLRHTFITNVLGNIPTDLVNKLAGHTKKNDTYDHRTEERLLDEVNDYRLQLERSL